jgi:hypothetical protein
MVLEALAHGRYVIWSYPIGPHGAVRELGVAKRRLAELLSLHERGELRSNAAGEQWVRRNFEPGMVFARVRREFRALLRNREVAVQ